MSDQRDENIALPSTIDSNGAGSSWVATQLLDNVENVDAGIYDDADNDQADRDLADRETINTYASIDILLS
jgi:hypothetical protein